VKIDFDTLLIFWCFWYDIKIHFR